MLRKIRTTLALVVFVLITLLFLDVTGTLHKYFGWLASIQFWPALLALHVGVVAMLVVLTLVFGRIYCSVICPLGVMQDIIRACTASVRRTGLLIRRRSGGCVTGCWWCSSRLLWPE